MYVNPDIYQCNQYRLSTIILTYSVRYCMSDFLMKFTFTSSSKSYHVFPYIVDMKNWSPYLYQRFFDDNYFPKEEFLVSLKTNPLFESYRPLKVLGYTISLACHLNLSYMLIFSSTMFTCKDDVNYLFNVSHFHCLFLIILFAFYSFQLDIFVKPKSYFFVILFLFPFTNHTHSLLDSIFPDTIWVMVVIFMIFNCIFHNFTEIETFQIPSQRISFNCGLAATVCLASRFEDNFYSFLMVLLGFSLFSIQIYHPNDELNRKYRVLTVILLFLGQALILQSILFKEVVVFAVCIFWINVISPLWLLRIQKHKINIYGPWDESN